MKSPYLGIGVGLYYLIAPFLFGYPFGFLVWQHLLLGAAVIAISLAFTMSAGRLHGWMLIAVGAYSMFAPFIHGTLTPSFAFFNLLVMGVITVGIGVAMGAAGLEYGRRAFGS